MALDWRKIALAVSAVVALGAVSMLDADAQSKKGPDAEEAQADEEPDASEAAKPKPGAKASAKKKVQDPAESRRAVDAAAKLVEAGKNEEAARTLTATLAAGNLPPAALAKAFYVRGLAYRQQGKNALAISDLTSALWLKGGLGAAERTEAIKQRVAAYREAGLTDNGEAVASAPSSGSKSWWGGETGSTGASSSGGSSGGWFSNIFGSGSSSASAAGKESDAKAAAAKPEPPPPGKGPAVSSGWANSTEVKVQKEARVTPKEDPPPLSVRSPPAEAAPPPPPPKADGRFKVQLGAVRTKAEAVALAAKAKREHGGALAAREPEISETVFGNMGAFYLVRIGPFATAQETQDVCAQLKGSGFDCMSVTR